MIKNRILAWVLLIGFVFLIINITFIGLYKFQSFLVYITIVVLYMFFGFRKKRGEEDNANNQLIEYDILDSIIGMIYIASNQEGICKISLTESDWNEFIINKQLVKNSNSIATLAKQQLQEYFDGERKVFDVPLSLDGTEFRKKVWKSLMKINYGDLKSYKDIAIDIGNPKGVRAIGQANRANPIPLIILCHRVVGSSGNLVGYMGSRCDIKQQLLELEGLKFA